jgi:hypothetical protein
MRSINATVTSQLAAGAFSIRQLVKLELGGGTYGFALSVQPITYSALEYKALGLIDVSDVRMAYGTSADDFTIRLPASTDDGMLPAVLDGYELECLSRAIDYSRRNGRLASDVDQQRRSSGDRFFSHTAQTGRVQVYWGRVRA